MTPRTQIQRARQLVAIEEQAQGLIEVDLSTLEDLCGCSVPETEMFNIAHGED